MQRPKKTFKLKKIGFHITMDFDNAFFSQRWAIPWYQSNETAMKSKLAKQKVWAAFDKKYPNANKSKFLVKVSFQKDHTATADIFFKGGGPYLLQSVVKLDSKFWSQAMKDALRIDKHVVGFPHELSPRGLKGNSVSIPAMPFHNKIPSLKEIFSKQINIFVTPDQFLTTKFREIFQQTKLTHRSGQSRKNGLVDRSWSIGRNSSTLQFGARLSAAGFLAKFSKTTPTIPPQVTAVYRFHVYFIVRRILFQMDGIQNISAFPDDPTFNPNDNKYDEASYQRLGSDFGVDPKTDFRYTQGLTSRLKRSFTMFWGLRSTFKAAFWTRGSGKRGADRVSCPG